MRVPRKRIKIAFRLWIPILVLRIVVAETWPQALSLSTLGLPLEIIIPQNIIILPDSLGIGMMLTFDAEALSTEANEQLFKKILEVWKYIPSSVAYECTQRTTGWGQKAIEVRSLQSRHLESELKRRSIKKLRFLCTRGDKLFFTSTLRNRHSRVYFMTLGKLEELQINYGV
uniref:non-specific serine/threonine protein kinase n=1 Tax=Rousettus aegyptiacus TaxID=9407 RepID=A0A7J8EKR4_ROUAE|nr:Nik related kinase [Rousettus aegyptiacus]